MRLIALLTVIAALAVAQDPQRDTRIRQDLQTLATELPRRHLNAFHAISQADFNRQVSELDSQIPQLTYFQAYLRMQAIVASIGDSHTVLQIGRWPGYQALPVTLTWYDDGIWAVAAAPEYRDVVGKRLVGIGGKSIDEVVGIVRPYVSTENDAWLRVQLPQYLRSRLILQATGIAPEGDTVRFDFQDGLGNVLSRDVRELGDVQQFSVTEPATGYQPSSFTRVASRYWFEYIPAFQMLFLQYNQCSEDPAYVFSRFASDVFTTMDRNAVRTLVIDLRNNTGGNSVVIQPLTASLAARLSVLRRNPDFRFYVLISKSTFSSGLLNAEELKSKFGATLVGEPTGGKPSSYGETLGLTLPNSALQVIYCTKFFSNTIYSGIPDTSSLMPDLPVPMRGSDLFARSDPYRMAVVNRAFPLIPRLPDVAVVNAASFRVEAPLAAGMLASLFGRFGEDNAREVSVAGSKAKVLIETPGQINVVLPDDLTVGSAVLQVKAGSRVLAETDASIAVASPGLFVLQGDDPARPGAILNEDSSVNSMSNRARRGSIVQVFATGYGKDVAVRAFLCEKDAEILYSGLHTNLPGVWQMNIRLPDAADVSNQIPLVIAAGGVVSNPVTLWVEK